MSTPNRQMTKDGAWIMITKRIPCDISPPLLSMFFAKSEALFLEGSFSPGSLFSDKGSPSDEIRKLWSKGAKGGLGDRRRSWLHAIWSYEQGLTDGMDPAVLLEMERIDDLPTIEHRVKITTEHGDVCVEPHEYSILEDMSDWFDAIGHEYEIKMLGGEESNSEFRDQLFYARSRGIGTAEATAMLLGEIKTPGVCWLKPHDALSSAMGLEAAE